MSVCIVGAGIAGLVLGRCLLRRGIPTQILEKSRHSLNKNNYGITLHPYAYRPLLGILDLDERAFRRKVSVNNTEDSDDIDNGECFRANRNRFERLLAEGLEIRYESEVESISTGSVRLKGGKEVEGKVIVGADGPHSVVRENAVAPEAELKVLPYAVYNGKRRIAVEVLEGKGDVLEERVKGSVFQISVNGRDEKDLNISYTYSRPSQGKGDKLFRPERAKSEATEIPEAFYEEITSLRDELPQHFRTVFDIDAMRKDRLLNWLMRTTQIDPAKLYEAAGGGIVLLGDSVHAQPILGGYGANEAIVDAMALAEFLEEDGERILERFYDGSCERWRKGVEESEMRIEDFHRRRRETL